MPVGKGTNHVWLGLHEVSTLSFSDVWLLHRVYISGCKESRLSCTFLLPHLCISLYCELHHGVIFPSMFDVVSFTLAIHFTISFES